MEEASGANAQGEWRTVVHDDPINVMEYVEWVFSTYFPYSDAEAHALMREVHEYGRAVVSTGAREKAEADAQTLHTFGLWATIEEVR